MRITNSIITNGMMLNINRNANSLNKYYGQIASGKQIQVPSDDPLRASRALKFRTNVAETEQYLKNVSQGLSWMEVTEGAFQNVNNIMFKIRDLSERASTDTITYEDRSKIMTDIDSLVKQIGLEMNVTYAGRYVFSGYRTDQPPIITEDDPNLSYNNIKQYFTDKDVQFTKAYERNLTFTPPPPPNSESNSVVRDVAVIKLAYTGLTAAELVKLPANVVSINSLGAYTAGNYIEETGELVLAAAPSTTPPANLGSAAFVLSGSALALEADGSYSITYDKKGFKKGELNPQVYFECTDITPGSPTRNMSFNPKDDQFQHFEYEFSINTRVRVNSNAPDVFTDKMYADFQAMYGVLQYINQDTREAITLEFQSQGFAGEALEDAVAQEMQKIQKTAQERFAGLIGLCDKHISSIGTEHTDIGSRMSRLDLIQSRLEDDRISYTRLMSNNEDVDYSEALMRLNSLESVYQASLKTGGSIMKLTLADYI